MDQEFRIPTKSQERVQNRDIIHDCISNFAGHNCGQELKYSCSCKVGFIVANFGGKNVFEHTDHN